MSMVKVDVLKPWITKRVGELLGMEDDVVVEYIFNQLETKVREIAKCNMHLNMYESTVNLVSVCDWSFLSISIGKCR